MRNNEATGTGTDPPVNGSGWGLGGHSPPRPLPTGPRKASEAMARKRACKPLSNGNIVSLEPTTEHPARTLLHALNGLGTVYVNAHLFRNLADSRNRAKERHREMKDVLIQESLHQVNSMTLNGATRKEQWDAMRASEDAIQELRLPSEPAQCTEALLENVLNPGLKCCKVARTAIQGEGTKGLDAATLPNASGQTRTIELHTKLQEIELVFARLVVGISDPRFILDHDIARLVELGNWFALARDELVAVIEMHGLDGPAPSDNAITSELVAELKAVVDRSITEGSKQKMPKTRRGLLRLAATTEKDQSILNAIDQGMTYRAIAEQCEVGKSTVGRVAKEYGRTGHSIEVVPLDGTLQENLSVRGKPRKHGRS